MAYLSKLIQFVWRETKVRAKLALQRSSADAELIGKVLWEEFFNNRDWPVASALAIVMLLLLLVPIVLFHRFQAREMEKHG